MMRLIKMLNPIVINHEKYMFVEDLMTHLGEKEPTFYHDPKQKMSKTFGTPGIHIFY